METFTKIDEEYVDIPGYEDIFQALVRTRSIDDEICVVGVKSLEREVEHSDGRKRIYPEIELKIKRTKDGYLRCVTMVKNKTVNFRFHVLTMLFKEGPKSEGMHCHHVDENKLNNWSGNLEYKDAFKHKSEHSSGENHHNARLTEAQVFEIHELAEREPELTQERIGQMFGMSQPGVSEILSGKKWPHVYKNFQATKGVAV
jgi:predicted XRE-type DNA-binding protein